jgi:serine/threonine protein kinase/WD40 repeat protein
MSQIIAGIYEIERKIGSGGGGVVYLGHHARLNKQIVLKADKRKLSIGEDKLRREVDLLKNLSQTYIPQVYDFVQENDVVYTVMDYIDGESLDKWVERGQMPSQPQLIKWACQLLEALSYLHSRKPYGILHGDIKPANIMLRPDGDICLIDFNIALALGEEGAVKVGYSRGYASPEHYGIDYSKKNNVRKYNRQNVNSKLIDTDVTQVDTDATVVGSGILSTNGSYGTSKGSVLLDVRSDIYSLGATLYHLISGIRPAQNAEEVQPLKAKNCNSEVAAIIKKAMSPHPDDRYQTADEMLSAFKNLYKTDKRVVRRRHHIWASTAVIGALFIAGGACTIEGMKLQRQVQEAITLAEYSADDLLDGNVSGAVEEALTSLNLSYTPQAQKALTDALGVYDLSDGFKALDQLELTSEPFKIAVSPSKRYFAVSNNYTMSIYDFETRSRIVNLPMLQSALTDMVFVDETHILYGAEDGIIYYDIENGKALWKGEAATKIALSGNGNVVAAVDRDNEYAVVYDVSSGQEISRCSFDGKHMYVPVNDNFIDLDDTMFTLNNDGDMLAVSFSNGAFWIYDLEDIDNSLYLFDESDYTDFNGVFSGDYLVVGMSNGSGAELDIIDVGNSEYIGGTTSQEKFIIYKNNNDVYIANKNILSTIDLENGAENEILYTGNANIIGYSIADDYILVAADNNSYYLYDFAGNQVFENVSDNNSDFIALTDRYAMIGNRNEATIDFLQLESNEDAQYFKYEASYDHDEARVSYDESTVMLFDYKRFRLYDISGNVIKDVELPDSDNIYDQQYRKSSADSYLEVTWYDGTVRCYSAVDGSIISEDKIEAPSKDLEESFYTNEYRIESTLHGAPKVYDVKTDKYIMDLESDAYLTYVTQLDDYIITEYASYNGERYGYLLNENLEKLAYLPKLCDVTADEMLIFDDESGNLRQSRLYSIQELVELGENYTK